MSDVQNMPSDAPVDNTAEMASAETTSAEADTSTETVAATGTPKLKYHEKQVMAALRAYVPEGMAPDTPIPYASLPASLMLKFLPGSDFNPVDRGLAAIEIDEAKGIIKSVKILTPVQIAVVKNTNGKKPKV